MNAMLLQATLNGALTKADHPAVPVSLAELAADAAECVQAGARAFHVHPATVMAANSWTPRLWMPSSRRSAVGMATRSA